MPSSYTPQQKAQISQFVGFTSTKDSVAAKVSPKLSNVSGCLTLSSAPSCCVSFESLSEFGRGDRLTVLLHAAPQISRMERGGSNRRVRISFSISVPLQHIQNIDWKNPRRMLSRNLGHSPHRLASTLYRARWFVSGRQWLGRSNGRNHKS